MSSLDIGGNGGSRSQGGVALGSAIDFQPTERERLLREWLLHDVLGTNEYKEHASWVGDQLIIGGFELPISNVLGFSQFQAKQARVGATQTTTSTTYTDLTTVGPRLTGLPDGVYLFFYGSVVANTAGSFSYITIQVNSDAIDANDATSSNETLNVGLSYAALKTLTADNNTVTMKYKVDAGTGQWYSRYLNALRVSNA